MPSTSNVACAATADAVVTDHAARTRGEESRRAVSGIPDSACSAGRRVRPTSPRSPDGRLSPLIAVSCLARIDSCPPTPAGPFAKETGFRRLEKGCSGSTFSERGALPCTHPSAQTARGGTTSLSLWPTAGKVSSSHGATRPEGPSPAGDGCLHRGHSQRGYFPCISRRTISAKSEYFVLPCS